VSFIKKTSTFVMWTFFCTGCHCSYLHRVTEKLATPSNKQHAILYMFQFYLRTTVHGELTVHIVLLVPDDGAWHLNSYFFFTFPFYVFKHNARFWGRIGPRFQVCIFQNNVLNDHVVYCYRTWIHVKLINSAYLNGSVENELHFHYTCKTLNIYPITTTISSR